MVKITIFPAPLPDELEVITDPYPPTIREFKEESPPDHFFLALIATQATWEIDLTEALSLQGDYWWYAHLVAKCRLALTRRAIIYFDDEPSKEELEVEIQLAALIAATGLMPEITQDTEELLILRGGTPPCDEKFLQQLRKVFRVNLA